MNANIVMKSSIIINFMK